MYLGNIYEDFFFIWDCNIFVVRNFSVFPCVHDSHPWLTNTPMIPLDNALFNLKKKVYLGYIYKKNFFLHTFYFFGWNVQDEYKTEIYLSSVTFPWFVRFSVHPWSVTYPCFVNHPLWPIDSNNSILQSRCNVLLSASYWNKVTSEMTS